LVAIFVQVLHFPFEGSILSISSRPLSKFYFLFRQISIVMDKNDKIPVTVYQIDLIPFEEPGFDFVVDEMIRTSKGRGLDFGEHRLELEPGIKHRIRLYFNSLKYDPKWKPFLSGIVPDGTKVTIARNTINSFICFIQLGTNIYAVAAGRGSLIAERYSELNFGLSLLVRLVPKESRVIRQIQDRGVSGIILGQTKHYRGEQRIADENQFGKIFKEVKAELSRGTLGKTFGFPEAELSRKSSGLFKSSFKLGKAINFPKLLDLVGRFDNILKMKAGYELNKVQLIDKRHPRNAALNEKLDEQLMEDVYKACRSGGSPDVDLCHRDFETFMDADSYTLVLNKEQMLEFEHTPTFDSLIFELKRASQYDDSTFELFKQYVLYRRLCAYGDSPTPLTAEPVWDHLNGEVFYEDYSYFKVDGLWYRILPAFIKELNAECQRVIHERWDTKQLDKPYPDLRKTEGWYNKSYISCAQTLVFDKILPDRIEACDILTWDNSSVRLIHVKKGFNNSVRELCSQIILSAKRIEEDIRTGYKGIERLEQMAKKCADQKIAKQNFPSDGLKGRFQNVEHKNIVFCLAVVDINDTERSLHDNVSKFRSNIAKYSLIDMVQQVVGMGFDVKIIQIKR